MAQTTMIQKMIMRVVKNCKLLMRKKAIMSSKRPQKMCSLFRITL